MTKVREIMKKMLVLGDGAVGKTSLIRRFVLDRFDDKYIVTIGTKTSAKSLQIPVGREIMDLKLQIWDILGQKGFTKLHNTSFKGTNGVFMVADVTKKKSLLSIESYWLPKVHHLVGNVPFVILANKSDLIKSAEFTYEDLREFGARLKVPFYLTSARNGKNVKQAFYSLGIKMLEGREIRPLPKLEKPRIIHPRLLFEGEKGEITRLIDKIIDDFCKQYTSLEDAMPVLRRQFELAKLDLNHPSIEALKRAIDRLALVEMGIKKRDVARADHAKRLKWIEDLALKV
jgi:small GTP-binding protein